VLKKGKKGKKAKKQQGKSEKLQKPLSISRKILYNDNMDNYNRGNMQRKHGFPQKRHPHSERMPQAERRDSI